MLKLRSLSLIVLMLCLAAPSLAAPTEWMVAVPVASVFKNASAKSERVTQALLGERVRVTKTEGGWARVLVSSQYRLVDGYPGWMLQSELAQVDRPHGADVTVRVVQAKVHSAPGGPVVQSAYLGTRLHGGDVRDGWVQVTIPGGSGWIRDADVIHGTLPPKAWDVIHTALQLKGTRYLWGGLTSQGIDCSGLTYESFRLYGITLPRDADQQSQVGTPVDRADLQTGDLVFFGNSPKDIRHVGIYMDKGNIVEAAGKSGVTITPLSARHNYQFARRVLGVQLTMPPPSP